MARSALLALPSVQALVADQLARCSFGRLAPASGEIECAVSGGADSSALLILAVAAGAAVRAVYVDHGLRAESVRDGDAVRALALRLGVPYECRRVTIEPGPNLEARARTARYGVLSSRVLTGHTADDLAETMLYNFARGAAIDGLSPMRERDNGPQRPIIGLRRRDTLALCEAAGVAVIHDSMNTDPAYARVRIREQVIPLLDDVMRRDVVEVVTRQWPLFRDDAALLDDLAAAIDPTDARALRDAPLPLARRAIRHWLSDAGVTGEHPAEQAVVARVLTVARGEAIGAELVGGWRVQRSAQRLRIVEPPTRQ